MHALLGQVQFHFDNNTHFIGFVNIEFLHSKYSLSAFSVDNSSTFSFCYEQKDVSVSVMNRKID